MLASTAFSLQYPWAFWLVAGLFVGLLVEAAVYNLRVWAIPAIMVYLTVGTWYLGNMIMQGPEDFVDMFGSSLATMALLQVIFFLVVYRALVYRLFRKKRDPKPGVSVLLVLDPNVIVRLLIALIVAWAVIFIIGLVRVEGQILAVLWPPSSDMKVPMFATSGVGSGIDFLVSSLNYTYILICTLFGVFFVISRALPRLFALMMVMLTWPYFFFDRTRNVMLAVLLPAVFCYWVVTWGNWWRKAIVSLIMLALVNAWFLQVARYRGEGNYQMQSLLDFSSSEEDDTGLVGLEMLDELCWMNFLTDRGYYPKTWGMDYVAEVAQIVPRTLWPDKPMLGIDYAIARGFGAEHVSDDALNAAGVAATVSTGLIGQGVGNFGPFFGVLAAAFLMAIWTKMLVGLWLRRSELLRFLLFLVGCGLTFNMGRDITLLVLWPFVFGYVFVRLLEKCFPKSVGLLRRPTLMTKPNRRLTLAPRLIHSLE